MKSIYLDNGSTTQTYKKVAKVMDDVMIKNYGNPSSNHSLGRESRELINKARIELAKEINARPWEITFTSGATESINLALSGLQVKKIIISAIEHSAVYETVMNLKKKGIEVKEISVNEKGFLDLEELEKEIDNNVLVSIIHGQNEFGVLQDLEKIGEICKKKKTIFHVDAAQTFGKEKIDVISMKIDLLSASAHKIHGPKGIGLLFVRSGLNLRPLIIGSGQEKGLRSGTENVPGILGFSKALELYHKVDKSKIKKLRDYFILELEEIGGKINGSMEKRLYNNINVILPIDSESLVSYLSERGIMCSTRSACSEKQGENRALKALGLTKKEIKGSFRLSLSEFNNTKEVDKTIGEIKKGRDIQKQ